MESLQTLRATPEMQMLNMRAALVNEAFQYGFFARGDSVDMVMGAFGAAVEQLA
jgi:hypothetical protein